MMVLISDAGLCVLWIARASADPGRGRTPVPATVSLMTPEGLGDFEDETWSGYACRFTEWTHCLNSTTSADCNAPGSPCRKCVSKRNAATTPITCAPNGKTLEFFFPAGGIFPVVEQFAMPPGVAVVGAANPVDRSDRARQVTDVQAHTWFVVPRSATLCGVDPMCRTAKAKSACDGDPRRRRQGFLMASGSSLRDINFQGADLGRAASEGTLCGPGAIELPGCLSGSGCERWGVGTNGEGPVHDVVIQNVRLSDAVKRGEIQQMHGDCATGEALDADGNHVPAHQVSVWVAKLPAAGTQRHTNVVIDNLVSMNSRADGFNVHGAVDGLVLQHSHLENSGDDCIGVWSTGIRNMTVRNVTAKNCAVSAGRQQNWGSCMGTYAFTSLVVDGFRCFDPFGNSPTGCNARTHYSAIHVNKAFDNDCMPINASLTLGAVEYMASDRPQFPLRRPKCGQCEPCCGPCSAAGFLSLNIDYTDDSVPPNECMAVHTGPGC